jgi:hypothetical protein
MLAAQSLKLEKSLLIRATNAFHLLTAIADGHAFLIFTRRYLMSARFLFSILSKRGECRAREREYVICSSGSNNNK